MLKKINNILALIPARGGSKSLPRKNILKILGRPMISWSIEQALSSNLINRVVVSTDDDEIAQIAKKYGAEVPFIRPKEFAQDLSPDVDVFSHALNWLKNEQNYIPELIVHLTPTCPARRVQIIDEAINKLIDNPDADSLRSISIASQTPFKMWFLDSNDYLRSVITLDENKHSHSMPRQILPKVYWQNGYVDITRPKTIFEAKSMAGEKIISFLINEEIHDVDYEENIPDVESYLKKCLTGEYSETKQESNDRFPV